MHPLYKPDPVPLTPEDLQRAVQTHWSVLAREAEAALAQFLEVPAGIGVLLTDRCTHALSLSFMYHYHRGARTVGIPRSTYRAAEDAAGKYEIVYMATNGISAGGVDVDVPTTLGGGSVPGFWLDRPRTVVDAAHSGYRGMFAGMKHRRWVGLCALSFYPTKPLGAMGGGALIGPTDIIEHLRPVAWPIVPSENSWFVYPQGIQSVALMARLRDPQLDERHATWVHIGDRIQFVLDRFGFRLRWGYFIPHVLSITHSNPGAVAALAKVVQDLGYEVGHHYPPLDGPSPSDAFVSLPFIYPELEGKLYAPLDAALREVH